jgi:ABC-type transport system involved in multi-copper enzyme maturation permease subunit
MTRARRWLEHLNPRTLFFGPVFEKEVYISGRKSGTYVVRGLAGLALLAVLTITVSSLYFTVLNPTVLGSVNTAQSEGGGALRLQQLQSTATTLAAVVGWFSYILLLLVTPVFLASSVMEEVRNRTLPALLTTPLTASDIILGKLTGRGVQILILALLPIPILLIARTFGGIPLTGIFYFSAIIFASVLEMAAVSIAISVIARRSASAIVLSYCAWFGLNAAPPIALAFMVHEWHLFRIPDEVLMALAAPVAMGATTAEQMFGQPVSGGASLWLIATIYHTVIALLLLTLSIALMRRTMIREGAGITGSTEPASKTKKKSALTPNPAAATPSASTPESAILPPPASPASESLTAIPDDSPLAPETGIERAAIRTVSDDPILWRELRTPVFRRPWHRWAAIAIIGVISLWITIGAIDEGSTALPIVCGILLTISFLQAAVLTTAAISTERESKTWETLLTTPLSGGEILWSKLAASLTKIAWPLLFGQVFILVFGIIITQTAHPYFLVHWLLVSAAPCFFLACTGILFGLIFPKPTVAAVFNLGLALFLWAVIPIVLMVIGQTIASATNYSRDGDFAARISVLINPYAWFGIGVEGAVSRTNAFSIRSSGFDILNFFNVPLSLFFLLELIFTGLYIAAGFGTMILAHNLFPRFSGRTPAESRPPIQPTPASGR